MTSDSSVADPARTVELIWAASEGDILAIRRLMTRGVPLKVADYDYRTPLHLAASEGRLEAVRFLLEQASRESRGTAGGSRRSMTRNGTGMRRSRSS